MQNLDVISINLWQIAISFCNLIILFLIIKRFLHLPVRRVINEREIELKLRYQKAENAQNTADKNRLEWENKMKTAEEKSKEIISAASRQGDLISNNIISEAKDKAELIIKEAKNEAEFEYKKAQTEIKNEIVDISAAMAEKILNNKIDIKEQHDILNEVILKIGDMDE